MGVREVIFIGLPGPTHSYGGLSGDNVASTRNQGSISRPQEAALQSIALMHALIGMGITVAVLPPQLRPHIPLLKTRWQGSEDDIIRKAAAEDPAFFEKACSSSAMWVANAATITPSIDAADGICHITTANLHTHLHRRIEAADTAKILSAIFAGSSFHLHEPLSAAEGYLDEGAANHTRLAPSHAEKGLHLFVYGNPGRQSLSASEKIAATHGLEHVLYLEQNPTVIEKGVFHNDVIAVGNASVLLCHEKAYANGMKDIERIRQSYQALHRQALTAIVVTEEMLSVEETVSTYFFNSQLVTKAGGTMVLIAPKEVEEHAKTRKLADTIVHDSANPIQEVIVLDLRQSMRNGGGPACLRLRAVLTDEEIHAIQKNTNVCMDGARLGLIEGWVKKHYHPQLHASELAEPALYHEGEKALAELGMLLRLPL